jgi:hypothetical protein
MFRNVRRALQTAAMKKARRVPKRGRAESLQMQRVIKIAREKTDDGWNDVRSGVYDDSDAGAFARTNSVQIEGPVYEKWEMAASIGTQGSGSRPVPSSSSW